MRVKHWQSSWRKGGLVDLTESEAASLIHMVKSQPLRAERLHFKLQFCHFLALWPKTSSQFFLCPMVMMRPTSPQMGLNDMMHNAWPKELSNA